MSKPPERQPDLLVDALKELSRVKHEPRLLVIITHGLIDLMVNTLIESRCRRGNTITEDHRAFPHSSKLLILHELGALTDHHYRLLTWFNRLRNEVAHKPMFTLSQERLSELANPAQRRVEDFEGVCKLLLLELWALFSDELVASFMPSYGSTTERGVLMVEEPAPEYVIPLQGDPARVTRKASDEQAERQLAKARETFAFLQDVFASRVRSEPERGPLG